MFQALRKWLAIRSYRRHLGRRLAERYGRAPSSTVAQVKRTIDEGRFNASYECYALGMYCDRATFDTHHTGIGDVPDYDAMQHEIGPTETHEPSHHGGHDFDHALDHHDAGHADDGADQHHTGD